MRAAPAKNRRQSLIAGISSALNASMGLPALSTSSSVISSACSSSASASLRSIVARSPGVVWLKDSNASRAAFTARSTSCCEESGSSAIVSPVAGFTTANVSSAAASTYSPPMKFWRLRTAVAMSARLHPVTVPLRTIATPRKRRFDQDRHQLRRPDRRRVLRQVPEGRAADPARHHRGEGGDRPRGHRAWRRSTTSSSATSSTPTPAIRTWRAWSGSRAASRRRSRPTPSTACAARACRRSSPRPRRSRPATPTSRWPAARSR